MKILKINMSDIAFNAFNIGDIVDVLPYDKVSDHHGISKKTWEDFCDHNPHEVVGFSGCGSVNLKYFSYLGWLPSALVLHGENATLPDITGLI